MYPGLSSHYSGGGFAGMNFKVNVVSDPAFSRWVELTSGTNVVLDAATYSELAKQSANVKPATYRFVKDSRLFEMIVS